MGEVTTERMEKITAATLKHADIKAELEKMRHLARLSDRAGFPTCRVAFWRRADLLEGQEQRARLFDLIRRTPWLDYMMLTKRPENMAAMLPASWATDGAWPNVWLGVSVENSAQEGRIDILRGVQAIVRFVSYEPALGPLTESSLGRGGIDLLIYGGESGQGHRPDQVEWARWARDACARYGTAFWFKQRSGRKPGQGDLDGETPQALPGRAWERLPPGLMAYPYIDGAPA